MVHGMSQTYQNTGMEECIEASNLPVDVFTESRGHAAEPYQKKQKNYRRLRSVTTNKILHQTREKPVSLIPFDSTAWYVFGVKRNAEIAVREFFNSPSQHFLNKSTGVAYNAEAYTAVQMTRVKRKKVEKTVIRGKIFLRVDEAHRVDVMKQCDLLTHCVVDRAFSATPSGTPRFARVPDAEIQTLKSVLEWADGIVEFSEEIPPQVNEEVVLLDGLLSQSEALKGLKGTVQAVNGKKTATVILNNIGCFKFILPLSDIGKKI